jgi:hypothetical protein
MPCIILDCAWFDFVRDTWYVVVVEGVSLFILVLIRDALSLGSFLSLSLCVCVCVNLILGAWRSSATTMGGLTTAPKVIKVRDRPDPACIADYHRIPRASESKHVSYVAVRH